MNSTASWLRRRGLRAIRTLVVAALLAHAGGQVPAAQDAEPTAAPADGVLVLDHFDRLVTNGLGADDRGGNWRVEGQPAAFAVADGAGRLTLAGPGQGLSATSAAPAVTALRARMSVALTRPPTGGGTYAWLGARRSGSGQYAVRLRFSADRTVVMQITREIGTGLVVLASVAVPGSAYTPGDRVQLAAKITGTTSARISAKAWRAEAAEPVTWLRTVEDASPITTTGSVGVGAYQSASAGPGAQTVLLDDLEVSVPAVKLVAAPADDAVTSSPAGELGFTLSSGAVSAACSLDGAGFAPCSSPVRWSGLADGPHTVAVRAIDVDGDTVGEVSRRWTVDTVAPTVAVSGPASPTTSTSATVSFTSSEPAQTVCSLDGSAFGPCTSPWEPGPVGIGAHAARVRATDAAGSTGPDATATWTVTAPAPAPSPAAGRPGPGNTGVPAGTKLTPYYGNLTITQAGARYDALDIHGFVTIKAPNVTITRSIIRGGKAGNANIGLVTNYEPQATNFLLTDSTLLPENPSVLIDGVKGANFTVRAVNISGVTDNVKVHGDNVRVERSYLHDSRKWASDPYQGGGASHNDAVQILGGRNISVVDSTLQQADNAGVQVTQDYRATSELRITGNYIDGGGCSVNLNHKKLSSMASITVSNNRFGTSQRNKGCALITTSATRLTADGNVWDATGQPIRLSNGG